MSGGIFEAFSGSGAGAGSVGEDLSEAGSTASSGGADPISAIANAVGALFGTFTQISAQTQGEDKNLTDLLLASQPKRPVKKEADTGLWLFIGMIVLLLLIIFIKLLL